MSPPDLFTASFAPRIERGNIRRLSRVENLRVGSGCLYQTVYMEWLRALEVGRRLPRKAKPDACELIDLTAEFGESRAKNAKPNEERRVGVRS